MAFDPTKPANHSPNSSAEMRSQLNGLKALIDAVPTVSSAVVDAVSTLPAGQPATVSASISAGVLHLSFGVPQGAQGPQGPQGPQGAQGPQGPQGAQGNDGPQGPPFASAVVDSVSTLEPGEPASVNVSFDGTHVRFEFGIPRGNDGPEGPEGQPGQVSMQQLTDAIEDTSRNSNSVDPLSLVVSDPPVATELQAIADKLDELINALRR